LSLKGTSNCRSSNTGPGSIIQISEDKLKLTILKHKDNLTAMDAWQMPLGILITIVLVFCTSDFQAFLSMSADTWKAIFIITGVLCFFYFCKFGYRSYKSKSYDLIADIKGDSDSKNK
jgi:hypothetical protein